MSFALKGILNFYGFFVMSPKTINKACIFAFAFVSVSSSASVAHLTLDGTPGDYISGGVAVDNIYSSADPLLIWNIANLNNIGTASNPAADYISFTFLRSPSLVADDQYATLDFSSRELGTVLTTGVLYKNAERAAFASAGHAGLDVSYDHRGCNTLSGSFMVNQLSLDSNGINKFSASFSQSCDGGARMNGTFFYDANLTSLPTNDVPEPTTLALIGLASAGLLVTRRRK